MPVINTPAIHKTLRILIFLTSLLVGGGLLIAFFNQIPIEGTSLAIDWKGLWYALEGGSVKYSVGQGFRIAPWSAALAAPLGLLTMRASWGLIGFITLAVLIISVPAERRKWLYWLSILLLALSFPTLRNLADGNFEAFVITGVLLVVWGYREQRSLVLAAGVLLAVTKPQETVLLMLTLAVYALPHLRRPFWMKTIAALAVVVVPFMLWKGGDWFTVMVTIEQQGSIMDMSLRAALNRTEIIPSFLQWIAWGLFLVANCLIIWRSRPAISREKAAMLVAGSLLLSPYAAGNSILTVLAVGIIPLFHARPLVGGLLIALISFPFVWNTDMLFYFQATYTTLVLLLAWSIFAWRILKGEDSARCEVLRAK